jgi:hypothetical protein
MLIDRTQRGWALATTVLFALATTLYVGYARNWPGGPSGRSWPGMWFGVAGTLLMVFAGLLAVRKKTVRLRVGSLSWWLRGHLWLGLLSVPMVFYHAAFRWGGTLEVLLWITFGVVIASGVLGLALQNLLPRMMWLQLPEEIIPDELPEVCHRLAQRTDAAVTEKCQPAAMEAALGRPRDELATPGDAATWLAALYVHDVRQFLDNAAVGDAPLASEQHSELLFDRARSLLPFEFHASVDMLEEACAERRQLIRQDRLYRLLHGWLKIHVPFSIMLFVFVVVHIVTALYW